MAIKSIKAKIIISIIVVLIVCLASFTFYICLPLMVWKKGSSNATFNKQNNSITTSENLLKVLQMTDLHLNDDLDNPLVYSFVKKLVYKADPDILVFTGDVFVAGLTKLPVKRFVRFVERFRIPWAITFGNHDREAKYSMDKLSEIFEDTKYCLFKKGNVQDRYGNYYYNVEFEDGGKFQLIFMDSGEDNFSVESVSFYENCVQSSKVLNNGQALNNFVFFHIPTIETRLAAQEYNLNPNIGTGVLLESVCVQENNVGFFNKAVELGATKALIYGHDHINNAKIKYQGIDLCYGLKTGARPYCNKDMLGGTLYTINSDSTYQFEDIYMK